MAEVIDRGREAVRDVTVDYLLDRLSAAGVTDADKRYDLAQPIVEAVLALIDARLGEQTQRPAAEAASTTRATIRARWTGNKRIGYRWIAEGGTLTQAQAHASATVVSDTWSAHVDERVARSTKITLPVGTVVVEHSDNVWTAAVVRDDAKEALDYSAARHVEVREVRDKDKKVVAYDHVIEVGGKRTTYRLERST